MSQAGKVITGGGGGGGTITTLTANTGGAVSPTAGNINVVGDGSTITISGNPGTSTLTASLLNQTTNTVTTSNATPTTIISFAMNSLGEAVSVSGLVIGARQDAGNLYAAAAGGGFSYTARYISGSGTAVLLGVSDLPQDQDSPTGLPGYLVVVSGQNILLQVVGVAAQTWNWKAVINIVTV